MTGALGLAYETSVLCVAELNDIGQCASIVSITAQMKCVRDGADMMRAASSDFRRHSMIGSRRTMSMSITFDRLKNKCLAGIGLIASLFIALQQINV